MKEVQAPLHPCTAQACRFFFYGSLINIDQLKGVGVNPRSCRPAYVEDYRVVFNKRSMKWCAAANLEKCEESGECRAYGIVCDITDKVVNIVGVLDRREASYDRIVVRYTELATGAQGDAYTYKSYDTLSEADLRKLCIAECSRDPYKCGLQDYLEVIAEGLGYWEKQAPDFKDSYIDSLPGNEAHEWIKRVLRELTRDP